MHTGITNVLHNKEELIQENVLNSTVDELSLEYDSYLNLGVDDEISILNSDVKDLILKQTYQDKITKRLVMPCIWNEQVLHLVSKNYNLSYKILMANINKLKRNPNKLKQYDEVIKQQIANGIVQKIDDLSELLKNSEIAFLPHSGVFKEDAETSKCRIVYLSNMKESDPQKLSHNQASLPGANLNDKLLFALTLMRFDRYLIIFDIVKAFHQIQIRESDQNKLLFLWVEDINKKQLKIQALKFVRLPFGLRFSPYILMMALYIILMENIENDSSFIKNLKKSFYNLSYMDNIAYTSNDSEELRSSYERSSEIFGKYKFELQKFATNNELLQKEIDQNSDSEESTDIKLFGLIWNRKNDYFKNLKLFLDPSANTKRSILSTVHSNFDPLGACIPIFNRARLFLHSLQTNEKLGWDTKLCTEQCKEWKKITTQVNKTEYEISIPRMVGARLDKFNLLCFVDASKDFYGFVIYIQNIKRLDLKYIMAKNRIINEKLAKKSIPLLELTAVEFGTEAMVGLHKQFEDAVIPINVEKMTLFSDSTISLSWLRAKVHDFTKIERKNIYLNNRLSNIVRLCEKQPVYFRHIGGTENPSDYVTRKTSPNILKNSIFFSGPSGKLIDNNFVGESWSFRIPNPIAMLNTNVQVAETMLQPRVAIINLDGMMSFERSKKIVSYVFCFINRLKEKLYTQNEIKYSKMKRHCKLNLAEEAANYLIKMSQMKDYSEVCDFFTSRNHKNIPIVTQLNLFIDNQGLIRTNSKLKNLHADFQQRCPILLHNKNAVAKAIIRDTHIKLLHAGIYKTINIVRKEFWIPKLYTTVRKLISQCFICKRMYGRTISTNQNAYRSYRINPEEIPFRNLILDYIGPFKVKNCRNENVKTYVLIMSCYWSRAVNLLICNQLDTSSFLRAIQLHIFEFGIPAVITSDNGTQIVQGVNLLQQILSDPEITNFMKEHNINTLQFQPYPSGSSALGGAIESLVKQVKILVNNACKTNILKSKDFQFLIKEICMIINKRPIAYKNNLTSAQRDNDFPLCMTPELIVKGYDVPSVTIMPQLYENEDDNFFMKDDSREVWEKVFHSFKKMQKIRNRIHSVYAPEFLFNLQVQATNQQNRYGHKNHNKLNIGDLVSIKEKFSKPYNYPMGIIVQIEENSLGEVNTVIVRKSNREIVRRHTNDLILILKNAASDCELESNIESSSQANDQDIIPKERRLAATDCQARNRHLFDNNLV